VLPVDWATTVWQVKRIKMKEAITLSLFIISILEEFENIVPKAG
jgi:hypothetical protein